MKATRLEYRLRYFTHALIYTLGFWAPWERYTRLSLGGTSAWTALASILWRSGLLSFGAATRLLLALACLFAVIGAVLRIAGASYLGASVVHSGSMHGNRILADGPYRFVRNPLYLGTICNTLALALLMPPSGAIFAIAAIVIVQFRLIAAEEPFLRAHLGPPYLAYLQAVPRLLPSLRPRVPAAADRPNLRTGILSEIFVLGSAITLIGFGFTYNADLILRGILISLGLSIVARAFIPRAPVVASAAS